MNSDVCWNARMSSIPPSSLIPCRIFGVAELSVIEGSGEVKVFHDNAFSSTSFCSDYVFATFSGPGECFTHYSVSMSCI